MNTFKCLYCGIPLDEVQNSIKRYFYENGTVADWQHYYFYIKTYYCPDCKKPIIFADGNNDLDRFHTMVYPKSAAKQFPDYIPAQIRQDYEEAYSIVDLSPKASATLSRRCLQGMIHDFHNIHAKNLNAEITQLKDTISTVEWQVLDGLRKIGNIGAHMEHDINIIVDIDPNEAKQLLSVIEFFIEKWYVSKHESEELFNSVIQLSKEKQEQRNS